MTREWYPSLPLGRFMVSDWFKPVAYARMQFRFLPRGAYTALNCRHESRRMQYITNIMHSIPALPI